MFPSVNTKSVALTEPAPYCGVFAVGIGKQFGGINGYPNIAKQGN